MTLLRYALYIMIITIPFCLFLGIKGVAKAMKEISSGAQKWEGQKWFSELSDKRKSFLNLVSIVLIYKMLLLSSQHFTTMAMR